MKMLRFAFLAAILAACTPASAQWQTANHSIPVGRGAGNTGFSFVGPCISGVPIVGAGLAADPVCGPLNLGAVGAISNTLPLANLANVPVSKLNSGTGATGSTFWRGDGTWATPTAPPATATPYAASINLNNVNQTWIPPGVNVYHLFLPNATKFNQNSLWVACCGSVGFAFVPPNGATLVSLTAQVWVTSGWSTVGGWTVKWIKNGTVNGSNNQLTGTEVCAGVGALSDFSVSTLVIRGDCVDVPSPGDYYNLYMFIDSTTLGVTTISVDGNPAHTYVQATVLR